MDSNKETKKQNGTWNIVICGVFLIIADYRVVVVWAFLGHGFLAEKNTSMYIKSRL